MSEIVVNEAEFRAEAETLLGHINDLELSELEATTDCTIACLQYYPAIYAELRSLIDAYKKVISRDVATVTDVAVAFASYDNALANLSDADHWFPGIDVNLDPAIAAYNEVPAADIASYWNFKYADLHVMVNEIFRNLTAFRHDIENLKSYIRMFHDTYNFRGEAARATLDYFQRNHMLCCATLDNLMMVFNCYMAEHIHRYRYNPFTEVETRGYDTSEEQLNNMIHSLEDKRDTMESLDPTLISESDDIRAATASEYDYSAFLPNVSSVIDKYNEAISTIRSVLDYVDETEEYLVDQVKSSNDQMFSCFAEMLQSLINNARRYQYTFPPTSDVDPIGLESCYWESEIAFVDANNSTIEVYNDLSDDSGSTVSEPDILEQLIESLRLILTNFRTDYFGLYILAKYLLGVGGDVYLSDSNWSQYMMDNQTLTRSVREVIDGFICNPDNAMEIGESRSVDITTHMDMENGEGIVGYQYLHGTSATVGDFHITGTITRLSDGRYGCDLSFTWNDEIDVNTEYPSDIAKNAIANLISNNRCEDYNIHISWDDYSEIDYNDPGEATGWLRSPVQNFPD